MEVRSAGPERGKGLFATRAFKEGDLIFTEAPIVAIQDHATRGGALVCSHCFRIVGGIEVQLANANANANAGSAQVRSQMQTLALSSQYALPDPLSCSLGCEARYCSSECATAALHAHHVLLCPGTAPGDVLREFYEHAALTNDVFRLAAQVVAIVLLCAEREVSHVPLEEASPEIRWAALQSAWVPFRMGHKALWWECVALPADIPLEEEEGFRADLQELATDSLALLTAALCHRAPHLCSAFPAILHHKVWGSIIGMFELNNLSLVVSSPVIAWAEAVLEAANMDELNALDAIPEVEALGGVRGIVVNESEWGCFGNAFYSVQACINHSCMPNARAFKRAEDVTGAGTVSCVFCVLHYRHFAPISLPSLLPVLISSTAAVILALCDINADEEITICYVDAESSLEERTESLRDYGFLCECHRCLAERLALSLSAP